MGEYREKITEKIISTIQNISLKGVKSETLQTEHIAGFSPYLRGYRAMGNLLQSVEIQLVRIWNRDLTINCGKPLEVLFHNLDDLLEVQNIEKRAIIIGENSDLEQIMSNSSQIEHIYLLCDVEYSFLQCFFQKISEELIFKVRFLSFFDEKVFDRIDEIRKIRSFWSEIMENRGYSHQIPVVAYINTIVEQVYALAIQSDLLLCDADNSCVNDKLNGFLIENSLISKTIDPFWK